MQVKKIVHLFSDSLKSGKFFVIEQFRRLVSITAQFIALIEQRKEKNVVKMDLANFLTTELRGEIFFNLPYNPWFMYLLLNAPWNTSKLLA